MSGPTDQAPEISNLRAIFDEFDKDKSGTVEAKELREALSHLGLELSSKEVNKVLQSVDVDKNGELDFQEFQELFDKAHLHAVFKSIDADNNGKIDRNELKQMYQKMGFHLTKNQLEELMKRADTNKDGFVDVNEFCALFDRIPTSFANTLHLGTLWLIPPQRLKRLRKVFEDVDTNNTRLLNEEDVQQAFKKMGYSLQLEEVRKVIASVKHTNPHFRDDTDPDDKVNFTEFLCLFDLGRLRNIFNDIDVDKSGKVSRAELSSVMKKAGWKIRDDELDNLLKAADVDQDGEIDFEEFCNFFEYVPISDLPSMYQMRLKYSHVDEGNSFIPVMPPPPSLYTGKGKDLAFKYASAAALASLVARSTTNPFDIIKLRKQTMPADAPASSRSFFSITRQIIDTQGFKGLYRGTAAAMMRLVPFAAFVGASNGIVLQYVPDQRDPKWRLLAIGSAATVASVVTYPMDLIRSRIMLWDDPRYKSMGTAFRSIWKEEGFKGLYRGMGPTIMALPLYIAIQQTTYEVLKEKAVSRYGQKLPVLAQLGIGTTAGIIAQTCLFPFEVVRVRMQTSVSRTTASSKGLDVPPEALQYNYRSTLDGLRTIVRTSGVRGLFVGISTAYIRVIPNSSIQLVVRDYAMQAYDKLFASNKR